MSAAAICDRAAKAAQTAVVASQVAAATSASGIATGESGTAGVRSAMVALALMEAVLEICPRGNNKMVIIIFPCS